MNRTTALCLLILSAALPAGCSQASAPSDADLQQRLDAANARTKAAEARIRASEGQSPWQSQGGADSATHETINNDSAPGAPMLDPAPVAPPQATGANLPPTRLPPGAIVN